jgi:hypothetical protein
MTERKPEVEVENWTAPPYIDPKLADGPPAGAWIDQGPVCRDCMKGVEENSMRRGFIDPITAKDAAGQEYICSRCGKRILAGTWSGPRGGFCNSGVRRRKETGAISASGRARLPRRWPRSRCPPGGW